jgi:GntR family transcriptional regulator, phosphonate transport system regulatory protein
MTQGKSMRPNGITLWRQIEQSLSADIVSGRLATDQRLPSSDTLAARFGVNRHTVRKAIARLEAEGLVRIERGRGTYAVVNSLEYNLGPLQLFEQNLHEQNLVPTRTVLSVLECVPPREAANALEISSSESALYVITLGEADGTPVNYGQHYIASSRLPGIADAFRAFLGKKSQSFSFASLFASCQAHGYRRRNLRIKSRLPSPEEAHHLNIGTGEPVLITVVTSVGADGMPLTFAEMSFPSDRTELTLNF